MEEYYKIVNNTDTYTNEDDIELESLLKNKDLIDNNSSTAVINNYNYGHKTIIFILCTLIILVLHRSETEIINNILQDSNYSDNNYTAGNNLSSAAHHNNNSPLQWLSGPIPLNTEQIDKLYQSKSRISADSFQAFAYQALFPDRYQYMNPLRSEFTYKTSEYVTVLKNVAFRVSDEQLFISSNNYANKITTQVIGDLEFNILPNYYFNNHKEPLQDYHKKLLVIGLHMLLGAKIIIWELIVLVK